MDRDLQDAASEIERAGRDLESSASRVDDEELYEILRQLGRRLKSAGDSIDRYQQKL